MNNRHLRERREFDLILYGASGFTGRLVAERLADRARDIDLRWAIAGRNADKLTAVRDAIDVLGDMPLIVADADDPSALAGMAARTRAVITTAGPFQLYGSALVAVCARGGTDYLDLSGETVWMRRMIDAHAADAEANGARILFSCGFDSIPFELGVLFLQLTAIARLGSPVPRAKGRVRAIVGRFSGGTVASGRATRAAIRRDARFLAQMRDPFSLIPNFIGPDQPSGSEPFYDADIGAWTTPFIMAPINTRNIHRSNALQGHPWGTDFVYDESMVTGPGPEGEEAARAMAVAGPLGEDAVARPGDGPTPAERDAGWYDLLFVGITKDGRRVSVSVTGDRDPGYGSTAKIVVEAALCLRDHGAHVAGGIWTPGAALGEPLISQLEQHAGLKFRVENT